MNAKTDESHSAVAGQLERGVRPHAIRLASQLQTAAYNHGYEDGHPSNATTRQDKYSAQAQRLRVELCEEIERLRAIARDAAEAATAHQAEVLRLRAALLVAVSQNEHDMLMTGDELRACRLALGPNNEVKRAP